MDDSFNMNGSSKTSENSSPRKGLMQRALSALETPDPQDSEVKVEKKVIILENGVFMIKDDLETSAIKQDPKLKELVDSVLR